MWARERVQCLESLGYFEYLVNVHLKGRSSGFSGCEAAISVDAKCRLFL